MPGAVLVAAIVARKGGGPDRSSRQEDRPRTALAMQVVVMTVQRAANPRPKTAHARSA